jgi:hypothetical protein
MLQLPLQFTALAFRAPLLLLPLPDAGEHQSTSPIVLLPFMETVSAVYMRYIARASLQNGGVNSDNH